MKLREQAMLKVEPQVFVPTSSRTSTPRYPWKTNIVTTVFWIGEQPTANNPVPNNKSSWDANWTSNYGGYDTPGSFESRAITSRSLSSRGRIHFTCALPYNDVTHGQFKPEAALVIPWFKQSYTEPGQSVCKDRWLAIRKGNRVCYAQWEDCGPFRTDHFQYVFQNERPKPNLNRGAGLDVSPAVRDYLGLRADRRDRLAICRSARCLARSMAQLRRQQSFRHRAASGSAKPAARRPGDDGQEEEVARLTLLLAAWPNRVLQGREGFLQFVHAVRAAARSVCARWCRKSRAAERRCAISW